MGGVLVSSTLRSDARNQHIADYYVTPVEKILEFLAEFSKEVALNPKWKVLDPTAGGDELHPMSYPTALKTVGFNDIATIDIREDSLAEVKGDYLELDCKDKYDLIITNPPFNISLDIITKALEEVKEGGYVVMLLRLNYFGGKVRKWLWDTHMPEYCFVHNKRISFTGGKTDSIEDCHLVWKKGHTPKFTKLMVI